MKRIAAITLMLALWLPLIAQDSSNGKSQLTASNETSKTSGKTGSSRSGDVKITTQPIDTAYTESIIKNTTDKMFLTEIVDHLPASAKVPTPEKILGYPIGTPNKLTYTKDQYRYYRELEKTTPRIKTFTAPEKSEQGREQMLVVVSDEANLAKL